MVKKVRDAIQERLNKKEEKQSIEDYIKNLMDDVDRAQMLVEGSGNIDEIQKQ